MGSGNAVGASVFNKIDLSVRMSAEEYDKAMPGHLKRMGELQREAEKLRIQVVIVVEGADASGKGALINRLIAPLDPRGFDVFPTNEPTIEESARPFFWRFWRKTPARGRIAIFSRSWYHRTVEERREGRKSPLDPARVREINGFEQELADDGYLFLKFWLHIGKKEQKARYKAMEKDPATRWMVTGKEWQEHKRFDEYLSAMGELMGETDTAQAPWTIVEAEDRRFAENKIFETVIEAFEQAIAKAERQARKKVAGAKVAAADGSGASVLDGIDLTQSVSDAKYKEKIAKYEALALKAQMKAYTHDVPIITLFEGWDAAGKGGDIKRLTANMDPRGYTVVPIGVPTAEELAHQYLWRFWTRFPAAGHVAVFDRSWYGRVLVERVEKLCRPDEWERAYGEINEMESQLVEGGAILVKFWLHMDKETQLKRFEQREQDVDKEWKITPDDWRNRGKWDLYYAAADEMLRRTSTKHAPWTVVESDDKNFSRLKTLKTVVDAVEARLGPVDRNGRKKK